MTKSVLLSVKLVTDAQSCGEAENRTAAEQIEFWAQLGKACEENPDTPTPIIKTFLDEVEDDFSEIIREMYDDPDGFRDLFQLLDPSFDPFEDNSDPRATVEYLFHLISTKLKKTNAEVRETRKKWGHSI